jgi:hypothetical protein
MLKQLIVVVAEAICDAVFQLMFYELSHAVFRAVIYLFWSRRVQTCTCLRVRQAGCACICACSRVDVLFTQRVNLDTFKRFYSHNSKLCRVGRFDVLKFSMRM